MAHPNEDLVRRGFDAFAQADIAAIDALMADDITWHTPGNTPLSGDHVGKEAVFAFLAKTAELSGGSFRVELHDVLANDEHAVALTKTRAERDGKTLEQDTVQVFHIQGGKVTETWLHPRDLEAAEAFWS